MLHDRNAWWSLRRAAWGEAKLLAIDAEGRRQALSLEACHDLRQERSRTLLDLIQKQIEIARCGALRGGALAKTYNYTLTPEAHRVPGASRPFTSGQNISRSRHRRRFPLP